MREKPRKRTIIARAWILAHPKVERKLCSENYDGAEDQTGPFAPEGHVPDDVLERVGNFIKTCVPAEL